MMKSDQKQFAKIVGSIAIACGKEINEVTISVYFEALKDLSIQEVESAANQLIKNWDKPGMIPTPGQFREAVFGDAASRSSVALETLKTAMSKSGSYKSVAFADSALMVAIEHHDDWVEICRAYRELKDKDVSYWEHNFKQIYQQAFKNSRKPSQRHLMGICEMQNSASIGQFTRGQLPEPEVDFYGADQKRRCLPLAEIEPDCFIVTASQKLLQAEEIVDQEPMAEVH